MKKNNQTLLILAAGLASRYGSLKQIDRIGPSGERIIDYSVYDAMRAGFGKVVYVIRKSFEEEFKEVIIDQLPSYIETDYVFQELDSLTEDIETNSERTKPWGTGHALLTASEKINEPFVVINADDFYGAESFKLAFNFLQTKNNENSHFALIGFELSKTMSEFGTVSRAICSIDKNQFLQSLVERTKIKWNSGKIVFDNGKGEWEKLIGNEIISMNMFAFTPNIFPSTKTFFKHFLKTNYNNLNAEFYLPSIVDELIKNKLANVSVLNTPEQWFGLTYKEDKYIVKEKILKLIEQGKYPEKLWE